MFYCEIMLVRFSEHHFLDRRYKQYSTQYHRRPFVQLIIDDKIWTELNWAERQGRRNLIGVFSNHNLITKQRKFSHLRWSREGVGVTNRGKNDGSREFHFDIYFLFWIVVEKKNYEITKNKLFCLLCCRFIVRKTRDRKIIVVKTLWRDVR